MAINTSSEYYSMKVPKTFDRLINKLPVERRERIEALRRALAKEYELFRANCKDPDMPRKPLRRS